MHCRDLVPVFRAQQDRHTICGHNRATVTDALSNHGICFRQPTTNIPSTGACDLNAVHLLEPAWLFGKIAHADKATSIFNNVLGLIPNVCSKIQ